MQGTPLGSTYISDKPCPKGHLERYVKPSKHNAIGRCVECWRVARRNNQKKKKRVPNAAKARRRGLDKKLRAIEYKGGKCVDCGWVGHHSGFEFDHTEPRNGRPTIANTYNQPWKSILVHLQGVELVCAICHNLRTWKRRNGVDLLQGG